MKVKKYRRKRVSIEEGEKVKRKNEKSNKKKKLFLLHHYLFIHPASREEKIAKRIIKERYKLRTFKNFLGINENFI